LSNIYITLIRPCGFWNMHGNCGVGVLTESEGKKR